jgi:hypothetical protein
VSLKDDVHYVKEELSSDEKILESAFRLEKFYKKHRVTIFALLALILLGWGGKIAYDAYRDHQLALANDALLQLEKNAENPQALAELKSANPRLYALYRYSVAVDQEKPDLLKETAGSDDPRLSDLSRYHEAVLVSKAGTSRYYQDLAKVEQAYLALKAGKKEEAKRLLALIGENSPVAGIARLLRHATLN